MRNLRSQLLIAVVCLVLGALLVTQFNTQRASQTIVAESPSDQAAYISDLYSDNEDLQAELNDLKTEAAKYTTTSGTAGSSKLVDLLADLHRLRMANGAIEVTGPGVAVTITGTLGMSTLQDVVNELRNAGAEAIAVNGVRLITRSVFTEDDAQNVSLDGKQIVGPYELDAIGEAHTLSVALQRKGGLISQIMQSQGSQIEFRVDERSDTSNQITMPASTVDQQWTYAKPATPAASQ